MCKGELDKTKHIFSLTLHIDREGACKEERLESWHGPTRLAVAQLLWDRLLPAHIWVSIGRWSLDLAPTATSQARTGWGQRRRAHSAVVCHRMRVVCMVDKVRLNWHVHGHCAVNNSVVVGWGQAGWHTILFSHRDEFLSLGLAIGGVVWGRSRAVRDKALWFLWLMGWGKRGRITVCVLIMISWTVLCKVLFQNDLRLVIHLRIHEGWVGQVIWDDWQIRFLDFRHFLHLNCGINVQKKRIIFFRNSKHNSSDRLSHDRVSHGLCLTWMQQSCSYVTETWNNEIGIVLVYLLTVVWSLVWMWVVRPAHP